MNQPIRASLQPVTWPAACIRRLALSEFRSYHAASITLEAPMVVLAGPNGAGKTNILEALSFFAPGRGLRRATLEEITRDGATASWAVNVQLEGAQGEVTLGTGLSPDGERTRATRIDGQQQTSALAFADHLRVIWLTPAMDGLFLGSGGDRRRFLDRLVLAVDPAHGSRVSALERALRSRNRLLEEHFGERLWLDAAERELAEVAVAVAAARLETVGRLAAQIAAHHDASSAFPWAELTLDGEIERALASQPATAVEDAYRLTLRDSRARDRAAGRTLDGPHLSDLAVIHGPTATPAVRASTGQQKALLIGLILAHARLVATMSGFAPLVLLDEVVAHLDPEKRAALFHELEVLGAQSWLTGADPLAFAELNGRADCFAVTPGQITRG